MTHNYIYVFSNILIFLFSLILFLFLFSRDKEWHRLIDIRIEGLKDRHGKIVRVEDLVVNCYSTHIKYRVVAVYFSKLIYERTPKYTLERLTWDEKPTGMIVENESMHFYIKTRSGKRTTFKNNLEKEIWEIETMGYSKYVR